MAAALEPKILAPIHRAGLVRRSVLLERLAGTAAPLVLFVAPPGYGKTTTVAQWVEADDRAAAWVTASRWSQA